MERTKHIHAKIQETPWHSGKMIREIELNEFGNPSRKDYLFAKNNGYIITAFESTCFGVRIYAGEGCWQ